MNINHLSVRCLAKYLATFGEVNDTIEKGSEQSLYIKDNFSNLESKINEKYEIALKTANDLLKRSDSNPNEYWKSIFKVFLTPPKDKDIDYAWLYIRIRYLYADKDLFPIGLQNPQPYFIEWIPAVKAEDRLQLVNKIIDDLAAKVSAKDADIFISLKKLCLNYVSRNSTVFKDDVLKKKLPPELYDELIR